MTSSPKEPSIRDFLWEHEGAHHLRIYSAIGRVVVLWGVLESHFSMDVMILYRNYGGNTLSKNPPYTMDEKISFWRRCFCQLPSLKPYEKNAKDIAEILDDMNNDRNILLHYNWGDLIRV
ncbi:MAG: hypothetical protein AB7H90_10505 [Alphaproteobacteria bacterium]